MTIPASLPIVWTQTPDVNLAEQTMKAGLDPLLAAASGGFKSTLGPWLFERDYAAISAGTSFGLGWSYGAGTNAAAIDNGLVMPFGGSIVGLGARIILNGGTSLVSFNIYKGGTLYTTTTSVSVPNSGAATTFYNTFALGSLPFVAGDLLGTAVTVASSVSCLIAVNCTLTVAM